MQRKTEEEEGQNRYVILTKESRNQAQENRVTIIAEAEQDKTCSDTIKVEITAMGEERKAPTTMEKNGYDFIKLSMIHD
jgi:hypothetical protein